jgi:general secretion pathway protein J
MRGRQGDAGISLVEVLVSLAIFAVIGVAGLAVLNTVSRTGERTEGRLDRLAEIDRSFMVIRRDLAQVSPGGLSLEGGFLSFRRSGETRDVPLSIGLAEQVLERRANVSVGEPVHQQLLTGVAEVNWRLLDGARRWHSDWPPPGSEAPGRPIAAELRLRVFRAEAEGPQEVTRLFALPAGFGQ